MPESVKQILQILKDVNRSGDFCVSGVRPFVLPGLEVRDVGTVSLPLTESSAKALIAVSKQAPYGRGTKTVVDTNVRKVRELDPGRFELRNPAWNTCVEEITATVQSKLGLGDRALSCHLYKLLIYQKGGFFLPHKDGEKADRMVATLVIVLPSKHTGGELIVRHAGQETTVRFDDPESEFQISFAAFYSDCEHEVKQVEEGYRLCLVYNLVLSDKGTSKVSPPNYRAQVEQLASLFESWKSSNAGGRLAVGLAHEYSAESLSLQNLKGDDHARALIIEQAAMKAGCRATLGLLTLWESGYGEDENDSYYGRKSRHGYRSRGSEAKSRYEMIEVYDTSLTAGHWAAFDGSKPRFGRIDFKENQVVSEKPLNQLKPKEDFEGYTGNEGMTLQRWYRQAIVAVWPEKSHYAILCRAGIPAVSKELLRLTRMLPQLSGAARLQHREACRRLAGAVISRFRKSAYGPYEPVSDRILKALRRIGSKKQFLRFLSEVAPCDPNLSNYEVLAHMCRRFGWQNCDAGLNTVFAQHKGQLLVRNSRMLRVLVKMPAPTEEQLQCCRRLMFSLNDAIMLWSLQIKPDWEDQNIDTISMAADLIDASCRFHDDEILRNTISVIQISKEKFDAVTVQVPAALKLIADSRLDSAALSAPVTEWLLSLQNLLEQRTAVEPQPPVNFTREAVLTCSCSVCKDVNTFLQDPMLPEYLYRARQSLREHLRSQISKAKADLNTETIRKGSPQSLLCRKTTESWKLRHSTWKEDGRSLIAIRDFLASAKLPVTPRTAVKKSPKRTAKRKPQ